MNDKQQVPTQGLLLFLRIWIILESFRQNARGGYTAFAVA